SELPKVLHSVDGKTMIQHVVERVHALGIEEIIVVVGYKREMVINHLRQVVPELRLRYTIQEKQLGTGHAVMMARPYLQGFRGRVLVLYGDMPLINPRTIRRLIEACQSEVKATLLTIVLDNPPDFGRIVRDESGRVLRVVEVQDATPEERAIREVNVGMYCFDSEALLTALGHLRNDNAQGEYYLTDVIGEIVQSGGRVETVVAETLEETLGINDQNHLRFAEALKHIQYAESLYELIDATLAMTRAREACRTGNHGQDEGERMGQAVRKEKQR
ncbi:MAG: hypothetical protein D6759_19570, partial [Chloroflexi bacterium]